MCKWLDGDCIRAPHPVLIDLTKARRDLSDSLIAL